MLRLGPLAADAAGKLNVLGHDGDTLRVNSAQVGVLEQTNEVSLRRFLESEHGMALETQVRLVRANTIQVRLTIPQPLLQLTFSHTHTHHIP